MDTSAVNQNLRAFQASGLATDDHSRAPVDVRPYLCIPYWPPSSSDKGDTGALRGPQLPSKVISYLCPSIHTSEYSPGKELTVTVDVRNCGDGNSASLAMVTVWWTNPSTGFAIDPNNHIGTELVSVLPRGRFATTKAMVKFIEASAPPHICLIARVMHALDKAGPPSPGANRHWAQRNLTVIVPTSSPITIPFNAANPFAHEAEFTLSARVVTQEHADVLTNVVNARPINSEARFTFAERKQRGERNDAPRVLLRPHESRTLHLFVDTFSLPDRSEFMAFEITQYHRGEVPVGSLGVVVRGR